jgi:hypothetical protein
MNTPLAASSAAVCLIFSRLKSTTGYYWFLDRLALRTDGAVWPLTFVKILLPP